MKWKDDVWGLGKNMSPNVAEMVELSRKIMSGQHNKNDVYALADLVNKYFTSEQKFWK